MKKTAKHPEDMTPRQLAHATRQFDKPFVFDKARPMTTAQRAQEHKLRRPRPTNGHRPRKISLTLQSDLLKKTDALARKKGINRSRLIADFVTTGLYHAAL